MKKFILLFVLSSFVLTVPSYASHLKGGEITWECLGSGQFIFQLKLYRDCNGIPLGPTQSICTRGGCPVTGIPLTLVTNNDLTPPGCGNSCSNPNGFGGATEEFIFQSNPITLTGTPPATGWFFVWDNECCRNSVDNVTGGTQQMALRSIMYPSPNIPQTNPCFDNSPRFAIPPTSFICVGYPYTYNPVAIDKDYDSLSYAFDFPTDDNGTCASALIPLSFVSPFSVNSPMPGNPAINPITGEFTLFPSGTVQGNYVTCIRVDSYRCGIKIASVFREIQVSLSVGGCDGGCDGSGNNQNDPPQINPAPFKNPITGLYTEYADTVMVGDTVQFNLNVTEFEYHVPGCGTPLAILQNFWIDAYGAELDSGSLAPYVNCDRPPCAYLNFTSPAGPFQLGKQLTFTWLIDCNHAANICSEYTPYFFVINAKDDACPAPAVNSTTFEIVVHGLRINRNGDTLFVNAPYANLQWYLNGTLIPNATNDTFIATNSGGIYTVQTLTPGGCTLSSNEINIVHVGLHEIESSTNNITLYPNPVSGILHVEIKSQLEETAQLKINDSFGREIKRELIQISNGNNSFDLKTKGLQNGIYYLSIKGKENIYSKRIIVMH